MNIKSRPYIYILCTLALSCLFLDLHTIIGLKKEGFCDGFPFTIGFHLYSSSLFYISLLLSSLIQINNTRFLKTAITLFYYTFFAFRNEVNFYLILQVLEGFILSQCIYCILKYNIIKPIVFSIFPLYILSIFIFMYCSEKNYMLFLLIICFKDTKIEGTYKNIILYILPFIPISIIGFIIAPYFISTKFHNNICYEQSFFSGVTTFALYIGFLLSFKLEYNKYINILKYTVLLLIVIFTIIAFTINNKQISKISFIILFFLSCTSFINILQIIKSKNNIK